MMGEGEPREIIIGTKIERFVAIAWDLLNIHRRGTIRYMLYQAVHTYLAIPMAIVSPVLNQLLYPFQCFIRFMERFVRSIIL